MPLEPEPVWWCWDDGATVVSTERPPCPRDKNHKLVSIGWRVGYNSTTEDRIREWVDMAFEDYRP